MVRVQIQLDPTRHRQLKKRAKRQGVSVAEIVRRCIDADLQAREGEASADRVRRALSVVGKYADPAGATHVARDHDATLAEAYRR